MLHLTPEILSMFDNGIMVTENKDNEYYGQGRIINLTIADNNKLEIVFLLFAFKWTTGRIDFPEMPKEWVVTPDGRFLSWSVDLSQYTSKDLDILSGEISPRRARNLTLTSTNRSQQIVFHPPNKQNHQGRI